MTPANAADVRLGEGTPRVVVAGGAMRPGLRPGVPRCCCCWNAAVGLLTYGGCVKPWPPTELKPFGRFTHSMDGIHRSDSSDDVEASVVDEDVDDCRETR